MNDSHHNFFSKLHLPLLKTLYNPNKVQDPFIVKKLSDYYMSRLIPDFFYHTPLANNYYPTIFATRVTLSLAFFLVFSYITYRRKLSHYRDDSKKYSFGLYTKKYLDIEKEMILNEKNGKRKIILN